MHTHSSATHHIKKMHKRGITTNSFYANNACFGITTSLSMTACIHVFKQNAKLPINMHSSFHNTNFMKKIISNYKIYTTGLHSNSLSAGIITSLMFQLMTAESQNEATEAGPSTSTPTSAARPTDPKRRRVANLTSKRRDHNKRLALSTSWERERDEQALQIIDVCMIPTIFLP